jgi:ribonucleotide monophosphatase NagD (HAD superfamily)
LEDSKEGSNEDVIEIVEFRHVIETSNENNDSYDYSYFDGKFDSIELQELKKIFNARQIDYFISNEDRIYINTNVYMPITSAFLIDNELCDSIMTKNLKPSDFLREVINEIPLNEIPKSWEKSIQTWF